MFKLFNHTILIAQGLKMYANSALNISVSDTKSLFCFLIPWLVVEAGSVVGWLVGWLGIIFIFL